MWYLILGKNEFDYANRSLDQPALIIQSFSSCSFAAVRVNPIGDVVTDTEMSML